MEAKIENVQLNLDDETLIEAAKILGTRNAADTVNAALREIVDIRKRVEAMEKLAEMGARGDFDEFLDKSTYRR
ncbi:Arc/MetJ family transcription regulator [Actinoplanes octamycinicus]|uniref:Arc/MetJ family transcription regulator n=1 Tax=Actinoplanes octamycinicus TaxID=135948 RepID=A0A7W7M762_9ACTN|nr:type II toxin-antitoxin system VapB family antitoxin [Actinoplanes octamycinicus]MBB4739485.1 Arc/MetJ family transcription regulator [Actinoplanes octamycinicus]